MNPVDLYEAASALPAPWNSRLLAQVGTAAVKVLRMDGRPLPVEAHDTAELLIVLDGTLELTSGGDELTVERGGMHHVAAGVPHAVRPGSRGALLIVEVPGAV
ncbi:cupin domain-containing protein [Kitasatospora sp. NPDC056327]|uniref:cupin domain-containing protein n=1 Tax=Kitasatospora sp. NPDC056327 TaxID=3345785 RepID=UPI0035E09751